MPDGICVGAAATAPSASTAPAAGASPAACSDAERGAAGVDAVDHHRAQGLAHRGFHGRFPAGVDVDQVEQGADDALDLGEALGARSGPGLVEREGQRLGSGGPRMALAVGRSQRGIGFGHLGLGGDPSGLGLAEASHQGRLGRLGGGGLRPQALRLDLQAIQLLAQGRAPGRRPGQLGVAALEARPQRRQLAAGLRGPAGGGGHAVGPLLVVGGARRLQRPLGHRELLRLGGELRGLGIGLGQLGAEAGGLGLQGGDHGLVDEGAPLALDTAAALGEHGHQTASALAQRLEAHERVAQVVAADVAQLGLRREDGRVELGEAAPQQRLLVRELRAGRLAVGEAPLERGQLATGEEHLQGAELGDQRAVPTGGIGLSLEGPELATDLAQEVAQPREVALGGGEPALGLLLALAVLQDAGRLLDDEAPVLGTGVEHCVDLALADDDVLLAADARVGQELLHVEEPTRHAVDRVLAVTRAEQRAGDRDLGEIDREDAGGVVDRERDLRAAERRALGRPREDDVVHLLGADRRRRLGAEHPADRVDDVGLAAAVGPDHHGDAGFEVEGGGVGEGLEALQREGLEEHFRRR